MQVPFEPIIGDWYKMPEGNLFEVVAVDEADGTVDVQHYDGTVEEFDLDTWAALGLETASPPEDLAGAYDTVDGDDYKGYEDMDLMREDWADGRMDDYE
ncbi:MAG: hypothetical protein M3A44_05025 [Gammaproteobacteria bacterium]